MKRAGRKKGWGGWLFLALVAMAYAVTALLDSDIAVRALDFSGNVVWQVLPVLVLVFLLLFAVDLLIKPDWIRRNLGREATAKGWLFAIAGGVLATGPVYAWYALMGELREKGMDAPLAAVFLYSRAVKLPLLPLMVHYFGATYTAILCLYLLGFSVVNGVMMRRLKPD